MIAPQIGEAHWLVALPKDAPTTGFVHVPIDAFATEIHSGDIAWLRRPAFDAPDQLIGWGTCYEPDREGTASLQIDLQRVFESPIALGPESPVWSLALLRDHEHSIHGVSGREAALIIDLLSALETRIPTRPDAGGSAGSLDEILLVAAQLSRFSTGPDRNGIVAQQKQVPVEDALRPDAGLVTMDHLLAALVGLGAVFPRNFSIAATDTVATLLGADSEPASNRADASARVRALPSIGVGRDGLWDSATGGTRHPALDDDTAAIVALADALARHLPIGSTIIDAHVVGARAAWLRATATSDVQQAPDAAIEAITEGMTRATSTRWRAAIGLPDIPPIVAAIAPDSTEGIDRLDRMPDISAFANAIASRSLKPPLSIGVFGEWGAGKTFFMRKLRDEIDRINVHVQEVSKQERIGYCERIAQVEFNAWHYADTELWPSLIHHLLGNLAVGQGDDADQLTERLLDELEGARASVVVEEQNLVLAKAAVTTAMAAVENAEIELQQAQDRVAEVQEHDVWDSVSDHPAIRTMVDRIRRRFGASAAGEAAVELYRAVDEAIDTVTTGFNVLRLTDDDAKVDEKRGPTVGLMVALTAIAIALAVLAEWLWDSQAIAGALAALGPVAAACTGLANWLRVQNARGNEVISELRTSREVLRADRDDKLVEHNKQLAQKRVGLAAAAAKQQQAELTLEAARVVEVAAHAALDAASIDRRLADFVNSRVASYATHLGLVSAVRQDFEKLGRLMAAIRRDADALRESAVEAGVDQRSHDYGAAHRVAGGKRLVIDRIVVYIDDLDRCSPEIVVKVLEAVHLLLAFDFVVVVVGVDARWVGRALLEKYPTLLGSDRADLSNSNGRGSVSTEEDESEDPEPDSDRDPAADSTGRTALRRELMQRAASEHDYLEKIFQVPYWLDPMAPADTVRLVSSIIGPVTVFGTTDAREGGVGDSSVGALETNGFKIGEDARAAIDAMEKRLNASDRFSPNPVALTINDVELNFMEVVYPLVGRSPRSAKRFVNVYRVIKAGLDDSSLESWVGPGDGPHPCHAAILLLAIVCGAPQSSTAVLGTLADCTNEQWVAVATAVERAIDPDAVDELRRWKDCVVAYGESNWAKVDAPLLKAWLPKVAQFSFRSGHLDLR